jgi:hypothetical protein
MVGQASSLSIKNDGQDARRHQILFLFAITFENPYSVDAERIQFLIFRGPPFSIVNFDYFIDGVSDSS